MPRYDYTCASCGQVTEVLRGIHDDGPGSCPACGAEGTMRKGFATPAVHFKGSGWAKKDRAASSSPSRSRAAKQTDESRAGGASASSAVEGSGGGGEGSDGASTSAEKTPTHGGE